MSGAVAKGLQGQVQLELPRFRPGTRVLLAEDNLINRTIMLKLLERMGLEVDSVGSGLDVLSALRERHYDLILMDCQMPELDGYKGNGADPGRSGGALSGHPHRCGHGQCHQRRSRKMRGLGHERLRLQTA